MRERWVGCVEGGEKCMERETRGGGAGKWGNDWMGEVEGRRWGREGRRYVDVK